MSCACNAVYTLSAICDRCPLILPQIEEPSTLPGWGMWAGSQREPKWMREAKEKAKR